MFTDPCRLIDETLDHLETLSVLFADEVDERVRHAGSNEPTAQLCREAQSSIAALIPKLKAAKVTQQPHRHSPLCIHCDE
jgi:hypothetical protein